MAPKRKDLLKAKAKVPELENDFLEEADEFEQAAGKWRAGDAAKATRFFNRAIDMYNAGLQRYPKSFDLAYNKANLEYNMSEDDRIVANLGNKIDLLQETLKSHRVALGLNPENTDTLFNTGQVLSSLAEVMLETETQHAVRLPARTLLEEAVDIFTRCLERQQQEYEQLQIEIAKANASQELDDAAETDPVAAAAPVMGEESTEASSISSDAPGEWATIEQPVTPEVILETCTAQMGALITLLGLYDPSDLPVIEAKAQNGLDTVNTKIPALISLIQESPSNHSSDEPTSAPTLSIGPSVTEDESKSSIKNDALLAAANFQVSIAEATYRSHRTSAGHYARQIEQIFTPFLQSPPESGADVVLVNKQSSYADALVDLASAVSDSLQYNASSPTFIDDLDVQWAALTKAQTIFTQLSGGVYAASLSPSRLADIFAARGDIDLFRFRISLSQSAKPAWVKAKPILVSNAGVFYRGSRSYAEKAGAVQTLKTADAKVIVAEVLKEAASGSEARKEHWKGKGAEVARVLEQMFEEGIIDKENAEGVLKYI